MSDNHKHSTFMSTAAHLSCSNPNLQRNQNHNQCVMDTSSSPNYQSMHDHILYMNVGGQIHTTTKYTMAKTGLFGKLFGKKRPTIFEASNATQKRQQQSTITTAQHVVQSADNDHDGEHDQKSKESHTPQRSDSSEIQYYEAVPREERIKRQTTFENYCVEHLEADKHAESNGNGNTMSTDDGNANKNKPELSDNDNDTMDDDEELLGDEIPTGIYQLDTNYYFVDRSPQYFEDILHFLRNYPKLSADAFVQRYYAAAINGAFGVRRNSLSALSSNNSATGTNIMDMLSNPNNASNAHPASAGQQPHRNHFSRRDLLKLQDEAKFYQIRSLVRAIQDRLNEDSRYTTNELTLHFAASASTTQTPLAHHPPHPSYSSNANGNLSATTAAATAASSNPTHNNHIHNACHAPHQVPPGMVPANHAANKPLMASPNSTLMLDKHNYAPHALSWWDQSGPLEGLRKIRGTRIAFATAMDNWVDKNAHFEAPPGYIWASQAQYLDEFYNRRHLLSKMKEWIHFGVGGWSNYRWKYARKIAFIFRDTFKGQRFIHSGMEVCDINHVKSLFGLMAESPLMEYDDQRGIVEGFAGLVLLSDHIWYGDQEEHANDVQAAAAAADGKAAKSSKLKLNDKDQDSFSMQSSDGNDNETDVKTKENTIKSEPKQKHIDTEHEKKQPEKVVKHSGGSKAAKCMLEVPRLHDDDGVTSDWTEDDEEQIRTLADQFKYHKDDEEDGAHGVSHPEAVEVEEKNAGGDKEKTQALEPIHSSTIISTASVHSPALPPPNLANPPELAAYTQRRRAALTQQNLAKHTKDEYMKHTQQQQQPAVMVQQQMPVQPVMKQSTTTPQATTVQKTSPKSLSKNARAFKPSSPSRPQFMNFGSFPYPQQVQSPPHHTLMYPHNAAPPMLSPQTHGYPPQHLPNGHVPPQHALIYPPNATQPNVLPMIPPPQLQQRLSVNSLPVQNNSRMQHHHSSRTLHNL